MKKITLILLTLLLSVALFVSCADKTENPETEKKPVDPSTPIAECIDIPYQYDLTPYITISKDDYTNLKVTKVDTTVTDDQLNEVIYEVLKSHGTLEDVTDRPAALGDTLNIDFKGFVDGVAFEGGEATDAEIELGAGGFIEGFEDAIVGHTLGEEFTIDVTFPEDYNEELAGKEAQFEIKINSIKTTVLPELTEAFITENYEYKSLEEFIAAVTEEIAKENVLSAESEQRKELYAAIYNTVKILDYPKSEYQYYYDDFVNYYETNAQTYYGVDLKTFITEVAGSTEEEFYKYADMNAAQLVEQELVIFAIGNNENLITPLKRADYDAYVLEIAEVNGMEASEVEAEYGEKEIWNSLIMETVFDYLLAGATVVDPVEEEPIVITPVE